MRLLLLVILGLLGITEAMGQTLESECGQIKVVLPHDGANQNLEIRATYTTTNEVSEYKLPPPNYPIALSAVFCGYGTWILEFRTATECVVWDGAWRLVSGSPCVWSDWTYEATVRLITRPKAPRII
jgi:hypothetical protein